MKIVLASASEYRKKILKDLGLKFLVIPSSIDEKKIRLKMPCNLVKRLSFEKAKEVFVKIKNSFKGDLMVIGADSVAYYNGEIIEKPRDKKEAVEILKKLSGKKHYFYSGATVFKRRGGEVKTFTIYDKNAVFFRKLKKKEIEKFVEKEKVKRWAGGYNDKVDKKMGYNFIIKVTGDKFVIGGLPVKKLEAIFSEGKKQ